MSEVKIIFRFNWQLELLIKLRPGAQAVAPRCVCVIKIVFKQKDIRICRKNLSACNWIESPICRRMEKNTWNKTRRRCSLAGWTTKYPLWESFIKEINTCWMMKKEESSIKMYWNSKMESSSACWLCKLSYPTGRTPKHVWGSTCNMQFPRNHRKPQKINLESQTTHVNTQHTHGTPCTQTTHPHTTRCK